MIIEKPKMVKNPVVSVVVITYNQEQYISQCIDAILLQQTDFPFELIISDDCSKDRTPQICREYQERYPEKIRLLLQDKNRGLVHNFGDAIRLARGKYIASIAGDDFWILDTKLQLQKDYLDAHPQCALCYTNINTCDESGEILETEYMNKYPRSQSFEEHLVNRGYIAPLTWMYRKELADGYDVDGAYTDESFAMALDAYATSEVHYIDIVTANYRQTTTSLTRQGDPQKSYRQWSGVFKEQCHYAEKYSLDTKVIDNIKFNAYIAFIPQAYRYGDEEFLNDAISFFKSHQIEIMPYVHTCEERKRAEDIKLSKAYRLGKILLKPYKWLKRK